MNSNNPYEKELTAKNIFDTVIKFFSGENLGIVKKFYDLPYIISWFTINFKYL